MSESLGSYDFWQGVAKIIGVYVVLSGDNAVVIALAARSLQPRQQKLAILWGSGAAIGLRILLTLFAVTLLTLPWLRLVCSLLLFWIGVKLLAEEDSGDLIESSDNLVAAIKTILIADLVMSMDSVIAVAAAAAGNVALLVFGLAISIPMVTFGATFLLKLMERNPVIITIGAALIGMVSGEMLVADNALRAWEAGLGIDFDADGKPQIGGWSLELIAGAAGAVFVVGCGKQVSWRSAQAGVAPDENG